MWRFCFCLLFPFYCFAQYPQDSLRDNIWLFGYTGSGDTIYPHWGGNIMSFSSGEPEIVFDDILLDFDFANSSICDTAGKLLYFCNGLYLANRDFEYFPGQDTVNWPSDVWGWVYGYASMQGVLTLPIPEQENLYMTITVPTFYTSAPNYLDYHGMYLYYNIIDMTLDNGYGDATVLNQPILDDSLMIGMLTSCRHANGRDWWIIVKSLIGSKYYVLLLDPSGLHVDHEQEIGVGTTVGLLGQAQFSPDGSKYMYGGAITFDDYSFSTFDFDRCTGMLSNPKQLYALVEQQGQYPIGCAVSPNSRYLYLSESYRIRQCDLWEEDVYASCEVVAEIDGFIDTLAPLWDAAVYFQFMQPGPDGKIYIETGNNHYLSVINQPDLQGTACEVLQHSVQLLSMNAFSIPNYPNFRLGPIDGSPCDTLDIDNIVATKEPPKPTEALASVYPNPASEAVAVQFSQPQVGCTFVLYNVVGEEVLRWPLAASISTVWVKTLPASAYYYVIHDSDGREVQSGKVMKL